MKKIILIAICAASISACALPTYEPFTEYSSLVSASTSNSINLCSNGLVAPGGEIWGSHNYAGLAGNATGTHGLDVVVTNFSGNTVFTSNNLSAILPNTFPGFPGFGQTISLMSFNPAQPNGASNTVGDSAVLQFANDITRPVSGTKTLFISYLFDIVGKGQTGTGNVGRYLGFLASSNLYEPSTAYPFWLKLYNAFGTTHYFGHGVYDGSPEYIGPTDSSAGAAPPTNVWLGPPAAPFTVSYNTPNFIVGEFIFTTGGSIKDTNIMWVNPVTTSFGGSTPPTSPIFIYPMTTAMTDVAGMVLIDRVGSESSGGDSNTYVANLMIGSTWSYVTGGPEFTTQPANFSGSGTTATLSAAATAAGQTVNYQWQHIIPGTPNVTNNVTSTVGGAGGSATVTGATSGSMTLANMDAADAGTYQVVAKAASTGFTLTSFTATISLDPLITAEPVSTTAPLGGNAAFSITATTANSPLSFQWQLNGANIFNNTTLADGSTVTVVSGATSSTLTIGNYQADENGAAITCGVTNSIAVGELSTPAGLTTADPAITSQPSPASSTIDYGATATFTASVATVHPGLSYAWYKGSTKIMNGPQAGTSSANGASGSTGGTSLTSTLTLSSVSYLDDGSYTLQATNGLGSTVISAAATLTVNDPYIVTQPPATVEVAMGGSANIPVTAAGTGLTYQWNNVPGTGDYTQETTSTLALATAMSGDAGTINVTVNGSSGQPVTSSSTTVIVENPVTAVTVSPPALTQQAGTHLALVGTVSGGVPLVHLQWQFNNGTSTVTLANGMQADGSWVISGGGATTLTGSGTSALVLSNIQVLDSGSYTLVAANAAGSVSSSASALTVSADLLPLSTANLVVTRIGEGSQPLSGATGNTLYLDQFTTSGGYVSTIMVPDSGTSSIIVPGGAPTTGANDCQSESYLTLSANQNFLNFVGYGWTYPYTGTGDVTTGGGVNVRAIGAVNALGYYVLAYTNNGIDSGGSHFVRSVFSTDGLTNFWVAGAASSASVKYVNAGPAGASYANGSGVPALSTAVTNARVLGLAGSKLVFSDSDPSPTSPQEPLTGLDEFAGEPEAAPDPTTEILSGGEGHPCDFAFSPDLNTVYVADDDFSTSYSGTTFGGIQRYDWNGTIYIYAYNLSDGTGAGTNGMRGLAVYFPPQTYGSGVLGAVLYATTSEFVTNRLITITDTGSGSSSTLLATAGPNQFLRGVRFGPAQIPVIIVNQPQGDTTFIGQSDTLSVTVTGDAPISYQWQFNNGSGAVNLLNQTNSSLILNNLQANQSGTYTVVVSNPATAPQTSSPAVLSVGAGPATLVLGPQSLQETVGDHTAFTITATGTLPISYQWTSNGVTIANATTSSFSLTNITMANSVAYTVTYWNQFNTLPYPTATANLQVTTSLQPLSSGNLVVARVGDGVQALSAITGNTVYLDQFTTAGAYANTIMIPDNAAAGGNLIVPGGTPEGLLIAVLTLSANNTFLNLVGFNTPYPATTFSVPTTFRSLEAVDAFGYCEVAQTNQTLYDASGNEFFDCAASQDGYAEFWTTGAAGSVAGLKYATAATSGSAGGIPSISGSLAGTRVVNIVGGNVVYSDTASSPVGLWGFLGEPTAAATPTSLITDAAGSPNDFAASPDTTSFPPSTSTVYLGDSSSIAGGGGIQRYDWNGSAYVLSYTLGTGSSSTVGAGCLTVDFSAHAIWGAGVTGAIIYATTAAASSNQLISIVDTGAGSSATLLDQANANELLRGVRFSPAQGPPLIASGPQSETELVGGTAIFTVTAQNGPLTYQWVGPCGNLSDSPAADPCGGGAVITGSQTASLTLANVGAADAGSYSVIVHNPYSTPTTSAAAVLTVPTTPASVLFPPQSLVETVGDHTALTVTAAGTPPFFYQWTSNGMTIANATTSSFSLTNITLANSVAYTVTVWNQFNTLPYPTATANLQVTTSLQPLSSGNLVVARVGDGVQALSTNTGNTVYLDQYTTAGAYANTIMIPDDAAAGGNLIVPGGAPEGTNGTVLTLSANNTFLNLVGYDTTYPATTFNVPTTFRAIEAVNAFGYYEVAQTNQSIYDVAGDETFNSAASQDGFAEFWTAGQANGPGGLKYATAAFAGPAGGNVAVAGSAAGTRSVNIVAGNVVYSDVGSTPVGIWILSGEPVIGATPVNYITDAAGSPNGFAFSPDTTAFPPSTSTAYVGDSSKTGGIQRYDWNGSSYVLSYTLATGGASCLTVDFSANATWGAGVTGAIIYATTAGASSNQLIKVVDTGAGSTATVLVQASAKELLRGVRFAPAQNAPIIATSPAPQSAFVGGTAVFTVAAQNGPLTYQWQWNGHNLANYPTASPSGSGAMITGAQTASLTVANVGALDDQGSYTVVVSNPFPTPTPSAPALLSVPVKITSFPPVLEYVPIGGTAIFPVTATGGGALSYQWSSSCGPLSDSLPDPCGSGAVITGSSSAALTIAGVTSADNASSYYVTVSNPDPSSATSSAAPSVLTIAPQFSPSGPFTGVGGSLQLNFSGLAGATYRIWGSSDLTLTPIIGTWTLVSSGTFSGGADSYTVTPTPQFQYYVITQP